MTGQTRSAEDLRALILRDPAAVLEDGEIMRALIAAGGGALGRNVVDLRGVLLERLEQRLHRLEHSHRSVIAAAYENLAGTHQVHRAVLALLRAQDFAAFLDAAGREMAELLALDVVRIGLETAGLKPGTPLGPAGPMHDLIVALAPGGVDAYCGGRDVLLRQGLADGGLIYGEHAHWVRSEAVMRLDLGPGRRPGMLLVAAEDPHRFSPDQGTDLLRFFGGVFELTLRRWLD
ncbi:MAG: DUF484 family protein [Alphaproteobacteria bacterium]|nr:MAG: DUF484 family protein [Alphaproteobacteria bacterium]